MIMTREERERDLRSLGEKDCIGLIRIYQTAIGTPHGQIPIPGLLHNQMIQVILKKEFPPAI
jgi:hypothetical protein